MSTKEFEILGNKVKLSRNAQQKVDPEYVVELVREEVLNMKSANSNLSNERAFMLVALKMAADKLTLEENFKKDINQLQSSAADALHLIEEVSPN